MCFRIANREDPDQAASSLIMKQSNLGLHCLSMHFWQASSDQDFKTSTVNIIM